MDTWPKWNAKKSPPVLEDTKGLYPNPKYKPNALQKVSKPKVDAAPKVTTPLPVVQPVPGVSMSLEGPTLLEQPIADSPADKKLTRITTTNTPLLFGGAPPHFLVDGPIVPEVPDEILHGDVEIGNSGALIKSNAPLIHPGARKVGKAGPLVMFEEPEVALSSVSEEDVSVSSEDASLDLEAAMAGIKGIQQDPAIIGQAPLKSIQSPTEIAKHFAVMGGMSHLERS